MSPFRTGVGTLLVLLALPALHASDWTSWRGPDGLGTSSETGLVSTWSPEGENLVWKAPIISRSTPVAIDGRICTNGRVGEGIERQEIVACFDADTGEHLWEHRFNVYNTTVPFNRVGWASLVADPETGNVYANGVAGQINAYAPDGKLLWTNFLTESVGQVTGYGGRTQTPVIHRDKLIIAIVTSGWGELARPSQRFFAFDKRTGDILWVTTPGGFPYDMNTQSNPVIATVDGRELLIQGNADGHVYALDPDTGGKVWEFELSRRGINSTVLVHDDIVYASHSEENLDEATMGRIVAIDAKGKGDITATNEIWRINEIGAGFPSPAYLDGKLYVVDNSGNLLVIDAKKAEVLHEYNLGTVGKASPLLADGKIYVPETNGRFHILKLGEEGIQKLDEDELKSEGDRYAELYGSPIAAYGRVYLTSEGWLYALGDKSAKPAKRKKTKFEMPASEKGEGPVATLHVSPTQLIVRPGEAQRFAVRAFDAQGRPLPAPKDVAWSLAGGLEGTLKDGTFTAADSREPRAGKVVAKVGETTGEAALRVIPDLPYRQDFQAIEPGKVPPTWVGAPGKYRVEEIEGDRVLTKLFRESGLLRNATYFSSSDLTDYTIAADLMGNFQKRRKADIGLVASGYTLDLLGNAQKLQIRTWPSENRMMHEVDFPWEMGAWYRMVLRVEQHPDKAVIRGKVWPRGAEEPADWSIVAEDPLPIRSGSPGLIGYSPADIYYDNIEVTENP